MNVMNFMDNKELKVPTYKRKANCRNLSKDDKFIEGEKVGGRRIRHRNSLQCWLN